MLVIYTAVTVFPDLGTAMAGGAVDFKKMAQNPAWPLLAVSLVIGFQSALGLKKIERWFRSRLHKWARIPEGAADTIDQLRGARFHFADYNKSAVLESDEFTQVHRDDFSKNSFTVENQWAKICCVLYNLRMSRESNECTIGGFSPACYHPEFFREYDMDYEEIVILRRNLSHSVGHYKEALRKKNDNRQDREVQGLEEILKMDINKLLERIYTFIACAVRSKQSTESEVLSALNQLGFSLTVSQAQGPDLDTIVSVSGVIATIVIMGVLLGPYVFERFLDQKLLANVGYLGKGPITAIVWAVFAVAFLSSAAISSLSYRKSKILRGKWVRPSPEYPKRPIRFYLLASIIGALTGYGVVLCFSFITLFVMNFFARDIVLGIPLFIQELATLSVWSLPAGVTAWFAVHHYDTPYKEGENPKYWLTTMAQMVIMGFIFFLSAWGFAQLWHHFNTPGGAESYSKIILTFSTFIAVMMFFIAGFMSYRFQKSKYESLFKTLCINCSYGDSPLPHNIPIFENGQEIGRTGTLIKLFKRAYTLLVDSDEFGMTKSFVLDLSTLKDNNVVVSVNPRLNE